MPQRPLDLEAIRQADEQLKHLMEAHPELRNPDRQEALAAFLTTLEEEQPKKKMGRPLVYAEGERPVPLSIRIPPALDKRLKRYAWLHRRAVSELVREAIERYLAEPAPPVLAPNGQTIIAPVADDSRQTIREDDNEQTVIASAPRAALVARVKTMVKTMRTEGMSLQQIADRLGREGVPTLSGKGAWQKGSVARLLG